MDVEVCLELTTSLGRGLSGPSEYGVDPPKEKPLEHSLSVGGIDDDRKHYL